MQRPELMTHRMGKGGGGCQEEFEARWRPVGDESKRDGEERGRVRTHLETIE